jgi:hypothetical protein
MQSRDSHVRSVPLKNGAVVAEYNRVGLSLAIFAALCFFASLWLLNGYFTARTVVGLGRATDTAFLSWGTGWLLHIIVSLIEQHLWKLRGTLGGAPGIVLVGVYALIIGVGTIDVLTSTLAFLLLFDGLGLPATDGSIRFISTLLAEVIAIIPEPIIVWLAIALWRLIRAEEVPHG